jgi:hypothetical protein
MISAPSEAEARMSSLSPLRLRLVGAAPPRIIWKKLSERSPVRTTSKVAVS